MLTLQNKGRDYFCRDVHKGAFLINAFIEILLKGHILLFKDCNYYDKCVPWRDAIGKIQNKSWWHYIFLCQIWIWGYGCTHYNMIQ